MSAYSELQANIASDLDRSSLTAQIQRAIKSAIKLHAGERFWFNETRDYTFNTVAATDEYAIVEGSGIADFEKVDYLKIQVGSIWDPMRRSDPALIEALQSQTQSGQPYAWSYFNKKFRLYPTPDAVYSVRVVGHYKLTELSADTDENAWTTEAQDMIEERAKAILFAKVIRDINQASNHNSVADMFLATLRSQTTRRTGTGTMQAWS